jgi:hypothetical protein
MLYDKAHENALRRKAERHGLKLVKSKRRSPDAPDYGRWYIYDAGTGRQRQPKKGYEHLRLVEDELACWGR